MFYIIEFLDTHPFWDLYAFFYRIAMGNFRANTRFSHWLNAKTEITKSHPGCLIYNKIFQEMHYNMNDYFCKWKHEFWVCQTYDQ